MLVKERRWEEGAGAAQRWAQAADRRYCGSHLLNQYLRRCRRKSMLCLYRPKIHTAYMAMLAVNFLGSYL